MQNISDNEVILIGKIMSGIQHLSVNKHKACRLKMKIDDKYLSNTIPIIFFNPNEELLRNYKNKEMTIIGHIEAKWNINIIVDAYKVEDSEEIQLMLKAE